MESTAVPFYKTTPFYVGVAVFFVVVVISYFLYAKFAGPKEEKSDEEATEEEGGGETAQVIFFYTTWCPYCKKSRPAWDQFKSKWNGQSINGTTIVVTDVDCDADEVTANKYNITGYPTVKCVYNKKIAEFDGTLNEEALSLFLQTCVG
jgi:thiol-disulfide isomerase/thioredoxin